MLNPKLCHFLRYSQTGLFQYPLKKKLSEKRGENSRFLGQSLENVKRTNIFFCFICRAEFLYTRTSDESLYNTSRLNSQWSIRRISKLVGNRKFSDERSLHNLFFLWL